MLLVSSTIAAAAVAGVLTAMGSRQVHVAWVFCWFGGIALARYFMGARAAGMLSGLAMGAWALAATVHAYFQNPVHRLDPAYDAYCLGVLVFTLGFGSGYALSVFIGGIQRSARWLRQRAGRRELR